MTPQEKSLFKKVSCEKGQDGCVFTHPIHLLTTAQSKLKKKIPSYVFSLDKFILLMNHCVGKGLKMSHVELE